MFMTSLQRPAGRPHPGRLQIGMVAAFKSEWVVAFKSESPAGFIGIRTAGISTYKGIAEALNRRGVKTARSGRWDATSVRRIIERTKPR
jgi:hypothetical protein